MEGIVHIIGLCGDNHSHFDLIDIIFGTTMSGGVILTLKYYWTTLKFLIKNKLKKLIGK